MQGVQILSHDKAASQAIRALLAGSVPNGETPDDLGDWWPTYKKLCEAYDKQGTELVRKTFDALANSNSDLAQLIAVESQPKLVQRKITTSSMENSSFAPLPEKAYVDPTLSEGACNWLDRYIAFSRIWAPDAYDDFHESIVDPEICTTKRPGFGRMMA